jgi:cleavage and polyadenylation specificity factor subunit 3
MTHATKAVMRLLVSDFIKLLGASKGGALYSENELISCIEKIEVVDYHHTIEHKGIKFCGYAAGHVLGAAMFTINIDGVVVLYTGDYSMEEDRSVPSGNHQFIFVYSPLCRHLLPAEIPHDHPDVLIVESTYGTMNHSSREERETRFTATVERVVRRGGNCLIPVFALGRAQELLLILDEYWKSSPDLHDIPIFYASRLASKALRVYQTFVNMMNLHIQALMDIGNPFHFAHIENMGNSDMLIQIPPPCVVMASPGFSFSSS